MERVPATRHQLRGDEGMSLIGLLVVLVVLGAMAAVVASTLTGETGTLTLLEQASPELGAEAPARPAGLPGAASSVACRTDVATLETAMGTAQAIEGTYPASLSDLMARGFLSELPNRPGLLYAPEVIDGRATGRVLVNGLPAGDGCQ